MLDHVADLNNDGHTYPPYNIECLTEREYRITLAVPGFSNEDIQIEVRENSLAVRGARKDSAVSLLIASVVLRRTRAVKHDDPCGVG